MQGVDRVRIDKWLWAARLFKSRSLATLACNAGHVKIDGHSVKASREVRIGDVIQALSGNVHRTVRVIGLLDRRVGPKSIPQFLEDQTPAEEYARAHEEAARQRRLPPGIGRPTKRQRRQMLTFFNSQDSEND